MKQKTIHVDFNDSTLGTIAREGEHNRTQLVFVLDEDLQACDFINVEFGIESSGEKLVLENLCPEEDEGTLKVSLTQDVTVSGVLTIQLVGYVVDSATAEPQIIAKSPVVSGAVTPSINGIKKIAQGVAGLLDRILAKVHVLIEKMHEHRNQKTLDKLGENTSGGLLFDGKDIGGVKSLTAFPETAAEGDVVLLHRCNEISVDDSNSGVVLDTSALASLTLPEGITDRRWEFEAKNPSGIGFSLTLEQSVIAGDEPYVLTGIMLMTETFGGRWYWRDGKPYYDIPNASADPIPAFIPLGRVESFTATKDPLIDENFDEHEDMDNTVIFRTVPRAYMYSGGGWKLAERTDEAEGSIISEVKPVVKDGQNFLELRLVDSRNFKAGKKTDFIYIPVAEVKDVTVQSGNLTLQGAEVIFPKAKSGGIPSVSALPETANEGDVVYYCPPPNTLTSVDSNKKIYLNFEEFERLKADKKNNGDLLNFDIQYNNSAENSPKIGINMGGDAITFVYSNFSKNKEYYLLWELNYQTQEYEFSKGGSYIRDGENFSYLNQPFDYFVIDEIIDSDITITDIGALMGSVLNWQSYSLFYTNPRPYRYTNGKWVEVLTPEVDTSEVWTAIDEIRGGINEIETLIDESGVLE